MNKYIQHNIRLLYIGNGSGYIDNFIKKYPQFKLRSVPDGRQAFEFLRKKHVDILVCDNNLLDISVVEFREYLKKNYLLLGIPFLVFCANEKEEKILQSKCDKFFALCFKPEEFEKTINDILPRLKKNKKVDWSLLRTKTSYRLKLPLGKRLIETVTSFLLLLFLSPILVFIALLIKIESKGPVFYKSVRMGQNMNITPLYKFRSMYINADKKLPSDKNALRDPIFIKPKNDARITKVGKYLRKYSLDELPQLINVLKGELCLIGNRPLPLPEAEKVIKTGHIERFFAPAGITGLWQVTGKKIGVSAEVRLWQDIFYSKYYSVKLDLRIFFKTFSALKQRDSSM